METKYYKLTIIKPDRRTMFCEFAEMEQDVIEMAKMLADTKSDYIEFDVVEDVQLEYIQTTKVFYKTDDVFSIREVNRNTIIRERGR